MNNHTRVIKEMTRRLDQCGNIGEMVVLEIKIRDEINHLEVSWFGHHREGLKEKLNTSIHRNLKRLRG